MSSPPTRIYRGQTTTTNTQSEKKKLLYVLAAHSAVYVGLTRQHEKRRLDDPTAETQHQVERRLLLNVVIRQRAAILKLLTREDQTLLIRRDTCMFLIVHASFRQSPRTRQSRFARRQPSRPSSRASPPFTVAVRPRVARCVAPPHAHAPCVRSRARSRAFAHARDRETRARVAHP